MTRQHPVPAAVAFLSVHGNAERFLQTHRADERGRCTGCYGARITEWPCSVARMARDAIAARTVRASKRLAAPSRPADLPDHLAKKPSRVVWTAKDGVL